MRDETAGKGVDAEQRRELVDGAARGAERRLRRPLLAARVRHVAIKRRAGDTERGIGIEHQPERAEFGAAARDEEIGQRGRQRSNGGAERADQAVAREHLGAALIRGAVRQHRVFERHQHAKIAAGRIDGSDEGDQRDQNKMLDAGKGDAGRRHEARARDQQRPQVMARRDPACDQRQQRRSQ